MNAGTVFAAATVTLLAACASDGDWRRHDHPPMLDEEADCVYHDCLGELASTEKSPEEIERMCRNKAEAAARGETHP